MTDSDAGTASTEPTPEQDLAPVESKPHQQEPEKLGSSGISLSIWPPTQRTRDAVISRLIETLSTPSALSKRYGSIPHDEAETAARRIEDEAFVVASKATSAEEDGLEILQLYSKEISRRMLETVKARPRSDSAVDNGVSGTLNAEVASTEAASEEISDSVGTEA
ncbi:hypothetical protein P3X46_002324 [Hevea brasiliensis]|uniref:WPP domain-containing protein n=1 Tax=Hevea brasiliensis TaxID=3981 RepID=A0ABQ9N6F4_HEVBR|nr:WPP domain-containing protein 2 [Hevea brasiliensis]KAJ9186790.1 hypothetical protein P3X46_002324 [Hevea brasiliensis]